MHSCGIDFAKIDLGIAQRSEEAFIFLTGNCARFLMMDPSWQDSLRGVARSWHYRFPDITDWNERTNWTPSHSEDTALGPEWLYFFPFILTFVTSITILNNVKHVVRPEVTSKSRTDWPSLDWIRDSISVVSHVTSFFQKAFLLSVWFFFIVVVVKY